MEEVLKELTKILGKVIEKQDALENRFNEIQAPKEEVDEPSKEEIEYFKKSC